MEQAKKIEKIKTKKDFIEFIYSLSKDFQTNPLSWENNNLGSFLNALARWVQDMEGYYSNQNQPVPKTIEWKLIAMMLAAAKVYE